LGEKKRISLPENGVNIEINAVQIIRESGKPANITLVELASKNRVNPWDTLQCPELVWIYEALKYSLFLLNLSYGMIT